MGYAAAPIGAYAELHTLPADRLVKLPEYVSDESAASIMLATIYGWLIVCPSPIGNGPSS